MRDKSQRANGKGKVKEDFWFGCTLFSQILFHIPAACDDTISFFFLSHLEDYHMSCLPLVLKVFTLGLLSLLEAVEGGSHGIHLLQQRLLEKSSP